MYKTTRGLIGRGRYTNSLRLKFDVYGMPSKKKKTEIWDIVPKGGRGSNPDPKFFTLFKWDIEG